jgi:hypothetical protein
MDCLRGAGVCDARRITAAMVRSTTGTRLLPRAYSLFRTRVSPALRSSSRRRGRGLLAVKAKEAKAEQVHLDLTQPVVLFGSGVLLAMASAAPRSSALAAAAPSRRRGGAAVEHAWVVAAAAVASAPAALWQTLTLPSGGDGGGTLGGLVGGGGLGRAAAAAAQLPLLDAATCGVGCSLGLAVAAMCVTVGVVAAPGVVSPQWLTSPGANPGLLMLSAGGSAISRSAAHPRLRSSGA